MACIVVWQHFRDNPGKEKEINLNVTFIITSDWYVYLKNVLDFPRYSVFFARASIILYLTS